MRTSSDKTRIYALIILLIVFLATMARVHHLDHESLFMDEIRQVSYYPYSLSQIPQLAASQQQPPLDYWIGHLVAKISYSDFAVRLPSALFGIGSVILMIFLIARLASWPIAFLFGVVLSLLPFHVYFSQEARPYSIAIFFLLATLASLARLLENPAGSVLNVFLLFCSTLGLLLSRTLSPLVSTVCLLGILAGFLLHATFRKSSMYGVYKSRILFSISAISLALLVYFPYLIRILDQGARYANDPTSLGLASLQKGISAFSLTPLWNAYLAQMEPVSLLLLPVLLGSILLIRFTRQDPHRLVILVLLILLPAAGLLNIFIFLAKTSLPFRPPYAIYLLPLSLLLCALTLEHIYRIARTHFKPAAFLLLPALSLVLIVPTAYSFLDFKSHTDKPDWRALSNYLATNFGRGNLLVFDGLHPPENWEPTFYGFDRYYRGNSPRTNIASTPGLASSLARSGLVPVLILFHYPEYDLTSRSTVPIMRRPHPFIDISRIQSDPALSIQKFSGFTVLTLKTSSGNSARDLNALIEHLLAVLPNDTVTIDLHQAVAALMKSLGEPGWKEHLDVARKLARTQ